MLLRKTSLALFALTLALPVAACSEPAAPPVAESEVEKPKLGLMTGLPLYWPLGAEFSELAGGNAQTPWQRALLEAKYELVLLDTLSPIAGLTEDAPDTDPLAGLKRLAIIQPRGLSPVDNVALDEWVRAGGHLLIALDPMLTGEYDLALGDPRRPNDTSVDVPVISHWGIAPAFSPAMTDIRYAELPGGTVPVVMGSELRTVVVAGGRNGCQTHESKLIVRCDAIGEGTVTFIGDAALFEHIELTEAQPRAIAALLEYAFESSSGK